MSTDVYPVGLLHDIKHRRIRRGLRNVRTWSSQGNWRAVRNYFRNGWLTEHRDPCSHDCGWGWTKRASARRAERACAEVTR
jgi:hypothetical protein